MLSLRLQFCNHTTLGIFCIIQIWDIFNLFFNFFIFSFFKCLLCTVLHFPCAERNQKVNEIPVILVGKHLQSVDLKISFLFLYNLVTSSFTFFFSFLQISCVTFSMCRKEPKICESKWNPCNSCRKTFAVCRFENLFSLFFVQFSNFLY